MTKAKFNTDGKILANSGEFIRFKKDQQIEIIDEDNKQYSIRILTGKYKDRETKVYKEYVDLN